MSEEKKSSGNSNYVGEVNILNDEGTELEIIIDGKKYYAVENDRKKTEKHPDYRLFDDPDKKNDVGAAWQGKTKTTNKDKLSISLKGDTSRWITAVMNEKEDGPSMYVFANPREDAK